MAAPTGQFLPAEWSALRAGDHLTVVKLRPDGAEATRYPGEVVAATPEGWLVVRAVWTQPAMDLDSLSLMPGDELQEWFSPHHPFNAFAVRSQRSGLTGWYANVTYPAQLSLDSELPRLVWHDLYVDLVGFPDGRYVMRDDDELRDSGLARSDPPLHARILAARAEMIERFTRRAVPFGGLLSDSAGTA